jgi:hypothetical protein
MFWCVLMPFPVVLPATRGTPRPPISSRHSSAAKAHAEHERLICRLTRTGQTGTRSARSSNNLAKSYRNKRGFQNFGKNSTESVYTLLSTEIDLPLKESREVGVDCFRTGGRHSIS